MKQRTILKQADLEKASRDILSLGGNLPLVITITEGTKTRTSSQNARHWCDIEYFMGEINQTVQNMSDHTGYTPLEIKKIISADMPPEHIEILYARTKEAVHNALKCICNIPTSTKLGTKEFSKFSEMLSYTMSTIIGEINSIAMESR